MNNIKFTIKKFGKIEEANIELGPLTMFIGDNNSGKSYLMSLLYGFLDVDNLLKLRESNIPEQIKSSEYYIQSHNLLLNLLTKNSSVSHSLSSQELNDLNKIFNEVLKKEKNEFVNKLFNYPINISELSVTIPFAEYDIIYQQQESMLNSNDVTEIAPNRNVLGVKNKKTGYGIYFITETDFDIKNLKLIDNAILSIIVFILNLELNGQYIPSNKTIYLPASRTGFMLTFDMITNQLFDSFNALNLNNKLESKNKKTLTKPVIDFLKNVNALKMDDKRQKKEEYFSLIQNTLIAGSIEDEYNPSLSVKYTPKGNGNKTELPLFITSGVVTELSPLVLFLNHYSVSSLMMEEPEMCLHPQLQWEIAKLLIRMSNNGIRIIVTTHSDTILQHINNMIKLGSKKQKNKKNFIDSYGYSEKDILISENIKIYQFETNDKTTKIEKLETEKNGFKLPTFYNVLKNMFDQSSSLEMDGLND